MVDIFFMRRHEDADMITVKHINIHSQSQLSTEFAGPFSLNTVNTANLTNTQLNKICVSEMNCFMLIGEEPRSILLEKNVHMKTTFKNIYIKRNLNPINCT